jgi:hypothetical protein
LIVDRLLGPSVDDAIDLRDAAARRLGDRAHGLAGDTCAMIRSSSITAT